MKKILSSILVAVFLGTQTIPASASLPSNPTWQFMGPSGGGHFTQLFADLSVNHKIWSQTDYSGVFSSTDDGDNWSFSNAGLLNVSGTSITQSPSTPTVFYHVTGRDQYSDGAVYSSTDSGVTWSRNGTSTFRASIGMHKTVTVNRTSSTTAYVGTEAGAIQRTTDRVNWSEWKSATSIGIGKIQVIVVDKSNTYLWIGGPSGIRRVTLSDGTVNTPTALTGTNATGNVDIVASTIAGTNYIFVASGNKVAYTTNNGTSWSYTADNGLGSGYKIARFDVGVGATLALTKIITYSDPSADLDFYSGNGYRRKLTGPATGSWSDALGTDTANITDTPSKSWFYGGGTPSVDPMCISLIVDPNNPDHWWKANGWEVSESEDFGVTWFGKTKGVGIQFVPAIKVAPDGSIYHCAMDNGCARSADGGTSWKQILPNSTLLGNAYNGHVYSITFAGTATDWGNSLGVAILGSSPWFPKLNKIFRSSNQGGGQSNVGTWAEITGNVPQTNMTAGLGSNQGFSRIIGLTTDPNDNGRTTADMWLALDGCTGSGAVCNGTAYGGIFLSQDAGLTWTRKTPTADVTTWAAFGDPEVNPTDSNNIIYPTFGNGSAGVRVTSNKGSTWAESTTTGLDNMSDVAFGSDGTAYLSGDYGGKPTIFRSTDKGLHWSQIYQVSSSGNARALNVDPNNPDRLLMSASAYAGVAPEKVFISENCRDAVPTFTDVSGNMPQGAGGWSSAWSLDSSTVYIGGFGNGGWKLPLTGGGGPVNVAPTAHAGVDQSITLPGIASLVGSADDDGLPSSPGAITYAWSKVSGSGSVIFSDSSAASTTATFSVADTYVLRLTANDSILSGTDDITIVVSPALSSTTITITIEGTTNQNVKVVYN